MKDKLATYVAIFVLGTVVALRAQSATDATINERLQRVLTATPLIDGHNDLPWEIRLRDNGHIASIDLASDTSKLLPPSDGVALMTDIPRLRAGHVGAQFWSVWVPAETSSFAAVQMTMEQIDLVKRLAERYPSDFEMAYSADDIRRIHRDHRIASLIGIEGGHQINNSLATLRQMYSLGARYMTLTHVANTAWADSATDSPTHGGLTPFGVEVVREMNRIGMLVDLSHVSPETMRAALNVSDSPVIYSHSSARALVDHPRDVPDDVLALFAKRGGIVMATFNPGYVSAEYNQWEADRAAQQARGSSPPYGGLFIGQPKRARAALDTWDAAHPKPVVSISQVADHIEHIRKIAGIDHVGIGSDFDGITDTPVGLDGVDKFPALLAELIRRGWSDNDIAKLAGENMLRVMQEAEHIAARLRRERPASEAVLPE